MCLDGVPAPRAPHLHHHDDGRSFLLHFSSAGVISAAAGTPVPPAHGRGDGAIYSRAHPRSARSPPAQGRAAHAPATPRGAPRGCVRNAEGRGRPCGRGRVPRGGRGTHDCGRPRARGMGGGSLGSQRQCAISTRVHNNGAPGLRPTPASAPPCSSSASFHVSGRGTWRIVRATMTTLLAIIRFERASRGVSSPGRQRGGWEGGDRR